MVEQHEQAVEPFGGDARSLWAKAQKDTLSLGRLAIRASMAAAFWRFVGRGGRLKTMDCDFSGRHRARYTLGS